MILNAVFALIMVELLVVGWIDLKTCKISNRWVVANFLISIGLHMAFRDVYPLTWETLIFPLGFIAIGFILYLLNIMGAGDSKFLASLFLIIPLQYHLMFFEKLVLSTVAVGATMLMFRIMRNARTLKAYYLSRYWAGIKDTLRSRFSYAPVICVAWMLMGFILWK
ncbi:MAG: prepilin peptidase [Bacteriovoracia bacterium]